MSRTLQHGLLLLGAVVSNQNSLVLLGPSGGLKSLDHNIGRNPFLAPEASGSQTKLGSGGSQGPLGDGFRAPDHPEWPWEVERKGLEGSLTRLLF